MRVSSYSSFYHHHPINHNYKLCACPPSITPQIIEDIRNGCSICQKCGVVVSDYYIDTENEVQRSFEGEDNSMTAKEVTFGNATRVDLKMGKEKEGEKGNEEEDLAKLFKGRASKEEVKLSKVSGKIQTKSTLFKLQPNITNFAIKIAKEFESKREKYARSNEDIFAIAALYLACKHFDVTRSLDELSGDKNKVKKIGSMVKKIRKLNLDCFGDVTDDVTSRLKVTSAWDLLPRFFHPLGINDYSDQIKIVSLAKKATDLLAGRQPKTIAAATLLFFVSEFRKIASVSVDSISNVCNIDQSTLRKSFSILNSHRSFLLSSLSPSPSPSPSSPSPR